MKISKANVYSIVHHGMMALDLARQDTKWQRSLLGDVQLWGVVGSVWQPYRG